MACRMQLTPSAELSMTGASINRCTAEEEGAGAEAEEEVEQAGMAPRITQLNNTGTKIGNITHRKGSEPGTAMADG